MNSFVLADKPEPSSSDGPVRETLKVGIAGLGTIGKVLAGKLLAGSIPNTELVGVAARDATKAEAWLAGRGAGVPVVGFDALAALADLVVECTPAKLVGDIAGPVLRAGKKVMVLSAGALLSRPDLVELAERHGGQIIVPTGALLGLDAVSAAAEGEIHSVRMITRKPVAGLLGAPYLTENNIDLTTITGPVRIFEGTAREAAKGFPANLNVAAALSLAGIGADRTRQEIWADPHLTRNTHRIIVDADSASFEMTIENIPSENPKTGRITALSVVAALRKINGPLRIST